MEVCQFGSDVLIEKRKCGPNGETYFEGSVYLNKYGDVVLASLSFNRTYITKVMLIQHVISFEDLYKWKFVFTL